MGYPVPDPTISYWQLPPHSIAEHRTTTELPTSIVFDYVIVGSGISGAAIAYKLLQKDSSISILMLEARTAASGASGRNGGHCRAGWWLNFKKYAEAYGEDEALKFERLEEENVQDIANFVREHQVDCDFQDVETSDLVSTEETWAEMVDVVRFREEVRQRRPEAKSLTHRKLWHGQDARDHLGIPVIVGAVTYPAHTQNPYRLVCRMLELSLEKGLNLQTNTLVTEINPSAGRSGTWDVRTERGIVHTRKVILATNGYTNALHYGLASKDFLTPVRAQMTAIKPGSKASRNPALRGSSGIDDFMKSSYFMCRAPGLQDEGSIILGGGKSVSESRERGITDDSKIHARIAAYQHEMPSHLFGRENWATNGELIRDWTGIVCYTPDSFPLVGQSPDEPGLWMSVGMNGHGSE